MNESQKPILAEPKQRKTWWIWLLFPLVGLVWYCARLIVPAIVGAPNQSSEFGDVFSSINALFSGLAFAGVIVTVWMQKQELELQREELKQTRNEIRGQKEQMELQNKTLARQQFEATFFQMLKLHTDNLNSIDILSPPINMLDIEGELARYENLGTFWPSDSTSGRDSLERMYGVFCILYHVCKSETNEIKRIESAWTAMYESYQTDLSSYFRLLYNILKFVDRANVENKKVYTNILRAQLSNFEIALVFYDSLTYMGRQKFQPLIVRYDFVKHVRKEALIKESHLSLLQS